jgi:hypothetical protein
MMPEWHRHCCQSMLNGIHGVAVMADVVVVIVAELL